MPELKDFFGAEFKVGDRVVYPTRRGSELTMNSARIVDLEEDCIVLEPEYKATWTQAMVEGQRLSRVRELHRVVIIGRGKDARTQG